MLFQLEALSPAFIEEVLPLLAAHKEEVAHYKDIELSPDWERYAKLSEAGALRIFTIRDCDSLVGYSWFFVSPNIHYKNSLQAHQDIIYLRKDYRGKGRGRDFILWCDEMLCAEGVEAVYQHVKAKPELDFSPLLEGIGYELVDKIWARRLN